MQTEERDLTPREAVAAYKELNEVERGFAQLKGLFDVRPVYHRRDERVRAHVYVAALALLLDRALEKKLRAAGSGLSAAAAWRALETVRVVELELGERRKHCVTRGSRQAAEVLRLLGLRQQLDPPRRRPPARKPSCSDQNQNPPLPFQSVSRPKRKHALAIHGFGLAVLDRGCRGRERGVLDSAPGAREFAALPLAGSFAAVMRRSSVVGEASVSLQVSTPRAVIEYCPLSPT